MSQSNLAEDLGPDTGSTVMNISEISQHLRDGQFQACQDKVKTCEYACCGFGLNNWIFSFPGEMEMAEEKGLSFDHLEITPMDNGGARVVCQRPCVRGEWKPLDCAIYPLWIAGFDKEKNIVSFITADNRKCPVSQYHLFDKAREATEIAMEWEKNHPGTIDGMIEAAKDFRAYVPFRWAYDIAQDGFIELTENELKAIEPDEILADDFVPKYAGVDVSKYTAMSTPEDNMLANNLAIPVLNL